MARCTGMNRRNEALVLRYRDLHGLQHFATVLGPSPPARATPRAGGRRALLAACSCSGASNALSPESRCTQKCCPVDRDTLTSHPHAICNSSYFHTGPVCVGNAPPSSSTSLLLYFPARAPQPSPEVRDRDRGDQRVERLGAVTQSMHSA